MGNQSGNVMLGRHFVGSVDWDKLGSFLHVQSTREAFESGLSLAATAEAKRSTLNASGLYTEGGIKAEMRPG